LRRHTEVAGALRSRPAHLVRSKTGTPNCAMHAYSPLVPCYAVFLLHAQAV
jgi:hypothetical protein